MEFVKSSNSELIKTEEWYDSVANILSEKFFASDEINIIDLGGADGVGYININKRLGPLDYNLKWNIVELPFIVEKYKSQENKNLRWHLKISDVFGKIDAIYSDSSIEFIEDWKKVVFELCSRGAEYIFLRRMTIGNNNTVRAKSLRDNRERGNYYGITKDSEAAHFWFINEEEFCNHMNSYGYTLHKKEVFNKHTNYSILEGEDFGIPYPGKPYRNSFIFKKESNE